MQLLLTLLSVLLLCVISTIVVGKSKKFKSFLLVAFLGVITGLVYNNIKTNDEEVDKSTKIEQTTINSSHIHLTNESVFTDYKLVEAKGYETFVMDSVEKPACNSSIVITSPYNANTADTDANKNVIDTS